MSFEFITSLQRSFPLVNNIKEYDEVFWINEDACKGNSVTAIKKVDIKGAISRLERFAPVISTLFPETKPNHGLIESSLLEVPNMKQYMEKSKNTLFPGKWYLKCDHALPISGSVKARGGIYEVLKFAESIAEQAGKSQKGQCYTTLLSSEMQSLFQKYTIIVGSTGNLGLSIGIISRKLGFQVVVHMSKDAKQWKKQKLREIGATVIEHEEDYSVAVEQGRKETENNPSSYFIDDENSEHLFEGYAVGAYRLQQQLEEKQIKVDEQHPLFVYLPCGVGGAPGGITYGLKKIFGEHVHCFFAEPTHSPAMLTRLYTGMEDISVQDLGIDNQTEADGLAVGKASNFVAGHIGTLINGCYTVSDSSLFRLVAALYHTEQQYLEPSALAAFYGPIALNSNTGNSYIEKYNLTHKMNKATHIFWGTGGSLVPEEIRKKQIKIGETLSS
ncbi:D-serine ammonia-lyase [Niallia sp. 01092]|uniref:D-serine ammonia-lyase n=1 Tax=unclassified Niallia TaxID=2837522 RepID=UPI003FCF304B